MLDTRYDQAACPKVLDEVDVTLNVVVPGDNVLGLAEDSRFKNDIVVGVAAFVQRTARNDDLTMAAQELQKFFYLIEPSG